jgi:hypothetical protein
MSRFEKRCDLYPAGQKSAYSNDSRCLVKEVYQGERLTHLFVLRDCPDFCVSKNGTVPFAASCATCIMVDTKILTAPVLLTTAADLILYNSNSVRHSESF